MILAIASSGHTTELWLLPAGAIDPAGVLAHEEWASGRTLADHLLSHLHDLLTGQSLDWTDLTGIVILSGPGSFTSLRIAHTVVNTLAESLGIPIAGATGEAWLSSALVEVPSRLPGAPVWPEYGGKANITTPR